MPGVDVPIVNREGVIDPAWYQWLKTVETIVKRLREEVP
jgi:hypothetical protein